MRRFAPLLLAAALCACSVPGAPGAGAGPSPAPAPAATAPPAPTAPQLEESVTLDEAGLTVRFPGGWHSSVVSRTVTLAPSAAAAALPSPGPDLVLTIDSTPLRDLTAQFGAEAAQDPEIFFEVSSGAAQREGYTISATAPITVDGRAGVQADFSSPSGAGRLAVIIGEGAALRVLGQTTPAAWPAQAPTYAAILGGLRLFAPPQPTAPPVTAEQPAILAEGPPGFVLRLGGDAGPPRGRFVLARGLAAAPDGTVFLAESSRGIWAFEPDGALRAVFGGDQLNTAYDIARGPGGDLFVADYGRNAVAHFRADGSFVRRWGSAGDAPDQFGLSSPQRIAVGPDGSVYALDTRPGPDSGRAVSSVMRFSQDGRLLGRIALPADLSPGDLAVDEAGTIYLADTFAGAVVKVGPDGTELARIGDPANPQRFAAGAIDVDAQGNIYLATYGAGVLKLAPSGQVVASGGGTVAPGKLPGPAEFSLPNGIAAAPGGVVWVSDNSGEYSAITALRLQVDESAAATAQAGAPQATAAPAPAPVDVVRQWASEATASSFYAPDYDPAGATGAPNVAGCQDSPDAWAPAAPDTLDTLEVRFPNPVFATGVDVHQSFNPGLVTKVELIDERGRASTVYTASPARGGPCPAVLEARFDQTLTRVAAVRLTVDQRGGSDWAEIDAVELIGVP
jgi:sugar lactone lactonase YvrE